jgi:cyclopropane fatty-acyl-phospholipid synthase-like methyltransferase
MARDTNLDWQKIGSSEPWWGVLTAEKFLKANLTQAVIEEFYQTGAQEIREIAEYLTDRFDVFRPATGLDFGCGPGRLAFPMGSYCHKVIGLDISPAMLAEGEKRKAACGVANVHFQSALHETQRVDWINSYIVFQHIAPRVGLPILEGLLQRLNLGGFISIQLTYFHDSRHLTEVTRDVAAYTFDGERMRVLADANLEVGTMEMFDYDLNGVFRLLDRHGLGEVHVRQTDHGGCHGVWLFGRKDR